jgi:hypothetical protein
MTLFHLVSDGAFRQITNHGSDVFTPAGRVKVGVIWDLSVKKIDDDTCEFTNVVHSSFTPELLDSLARQGIPWEVFQAARKPVTEAHNQQETPLFAMSIERHALRNSSFTGAAKFIREGENVEGNKSRERNATSGF